jgi:hypothetical protein
MALTAAAQIDSFCSGSASLSALISQRTSAVLAAAEAILHRLSVAPYTHKLLNMHGAANRIIIAVPFFHPNDSLIDQALVEFRHLFENDYDR